MTLQNDAAAVEAQAKASAVHAENRFIHFVVVHPKTTIEIAIALILVGVGIPLAQLFAGKLLGL